MALPNSRDITIAPGSQIPSTLLNNLQDFIISGGHGLLWHKIGAADFSGQSSQVVAGTLIFSTASIGAAPNRWTSTAISQLVTWSPPFKEGTVIAEFDFHEQDNNVTPNELRARESTFGVDSSTAALTLFTFAISAVDKITNLSSANYAVLPYTITATELVDFRFGLVTSTSRFYGGRVRISKP